MQLLLIVCLKDYIHFQHTYNIIYIHVHEQYTEFFDSKRKCLYDYKHHDVMRYSLRPKPRGTSWSDTRKHRIWHQTPEQRGMRGRIGNPLHM